MSASFGHGNADSNGRRTVFLKSAAATAGAWTKAQSRNDDWAPEQSPNTTLILVVPSLLQNSTELQAMELAR